MKNNIGASNRRIGDLIDDVIAGRLQIRPFFQRRLVWNNDDKESFIDTVLKGFPFPEIFVAEGKREGQSTRREKLLVDGQQRVSTLISYYQGSKDLLYRKIVPFSSLEEDDRDEFLDYLVAVRDLGTASNDVIREIFKRINSTDFALKSMEILNAMFSGAYKQFCEQLSRDDFFERHKVFPKAYKKRMYDVTFCVILVTTILSGYYKRDERNEEYLELYNNEFPQTDAVRVGLDRVFDFVEKCGFDDSSRAWKQTDLFSILVELYSALVTDNLELDPAAVGERMKTFLLKVDELYAGGTLPQENSVPATSRDIFTYLKAATKATNDKYSRVDRARIISNLIRGTDAEVAVEPEKDAPRAKRRRGKKE